jgi:hypothetical protein
MSRLALHKYKFEERKKAMLPALLDTAFEVRLAGSVDAALADADLAGAATFFLHANPAAGRVDLCGGAGAGQLKRKLGAALLKVLMPQTTVHYIAELSIKAQLNAFYYNYAAGFGAV